MNALIPSSPMFDSVEVVRDVNPSVNADNMLPAKIVGHPELYFAANWRGEAVTCQCGRLRLYKDIGAEYRSVCPCGRFGAEPKKVAA